jgi:hypothetical protein
VSDLSSRHDTLSVLAGFPPQLAAAVQAAADRPVPDGTWSPTEVVRHLIAVESDVHQARLEDLDRAAIPTWQWEEPPPWSGEPQLRMDGLLTRFASLRATTVRTVEDLDDAGWKRSGRHAVLGVLDVAGLLANAVDHDQAHLEDLARR